VADNKSSCGWAIGIAGMALPVIYLINSFKNCDLPLALPTSRDRLTWWRGADGSL